MHEVAPSVLKDADKVTQRFKKITKWLHIGAQRLHCIICISIIVNYYLSTLTSDNLSVATNFSQVTYVAQCTGMQNVAQ